MANDKPTREEKWLPSHQAVKELRVSSCELMHLRESGVLRFKKQGNAFLYIAEDVIRNRNKSTNG